jgi:hypothetical protein
MLLLQGCTGAVSHSTKCNRCCALGAPLQKAYAAALATPTKANPAREREDRRRLSHDAVKLGLLLDSDKSLQPGESVRTAVGELLRLPLAARPHVTHRQADTHMICVSKSQRLCVSAKVCLAAVQAFVLRWQPRQQCSGPCRRLHCNAARRAACRPSMCGVIGAGADLAP